MKISITVVVLTAIFYITSVNFLHPSLARTPLCISGTGFNAGNGTVGGVGEWMKSGYFV